MSTQGRPDIPHDHNGAAHTSHQSEPHSAHSPHHAPTPHFHAPAPAPAPTQANITELQNQCASELHPQPNQENPAAQPHFDGSALAEPPSEREYAASETEPHPENEPLSAYDPNALLHALAVLDFSPDALAQQLNRSPFELLDFLESEFAQSQLTRYRTLERQMLDLRAFKSRRLAIENLEHVLESTHDLIEKRRTATTLLRLLIAPTTRARSTPTANTDQSSAHTNPSPTPRTPTTNQAASPPFHGSAPAEPPASASEREAPIAQQSSAPQPPFHGSAQAEPPPNNTAAQPRFHGSATAEPPSASDLADQSDSEPPHKPDSEHDNPHNSYRDPNSAAAQPPFHGSAHAEPPSESELAGQSASELPDQSDSELVDQSDSERQTQPDSERDNQRASEPRIHPAGNRRDTQASASTTNSQAAQPPFDGSAQAEPPASDSELEINRAQDNSAAQPRFHGSATAEPPSASKPETPSASEYRSKPASERDDGCGSEPAHDEPAEGPHPPTGDIDWDAFFPEAFNGHRHDTPPTPHQRE